MLIDLESARVITRRLLRWGRRNFQDYPWRRTTNDWQALVAEVLLQRTRANSVVPVFNEFVARYPTPAALARSSQAELETLIFPLGLRWRGPLLLQLGAALEALGGEVPRDLKALGALPGVGPYASSSWLAFHGGKRAVIIDANVVRVICRLTGNQMDGETRRKRWLADQADMLTPKRSWRAYNYAILDFGMLICRPHPVCDGCPLGWLCRHTFEFAPSPTPISAHLNRSP